MALTRDEWDPAQDERPAQPKLKPSVTETGELFWVLGVTLRAGKSWPVDCHARMFVWRTTSGDLLIDHGRYWPMQADGDDGA